jgi:polar amino acid transport system substrate-binding protein
MSLKSTCSIATVCLSLLVSANTAFAAGECAAGKTMKEGILTIATGNPSYFPWVIDNKPEDGKGFEAAVAYEVANRMGFDNAKVEWTTASFDESIQPGEKNFDFNLQQFSITEEREKVVDFSVPYYSAAMAVLVRKPTQEKGAKPEMDSLKGLLWGADASTTALPTLNKLIEPSEKPLLYNDNNDVVAAMKANQIDAALFDLPTAMYLGAVVLDDGVVLGQFPADRTEQPDQFGLLMSEGNPLKTCVNEALEAMKADGKLASIEAAWLQQTTGVPVIK